MSVFGRRRGGTRAGAQSTAPPEAPGVKPAKLGACAAAIRARQRSLAVRRGYASLGVRAAVVAIAAVLLFSCMLLVSQVQGNDMFPAVKDGDVVLGYRLQTAYQSGDVVVYAVGGQERIGRVVATSGDVVSLGESGSVQVNGTTLDAEVVYPTYAKDAVTYPYQVPESSVFVLGDMRTQATDSRDFGAIAASDVKAKVITILRRRGV